MAEKCYYEVTEYRKKKNSKQGYREFDTDRFDNKNYAIKFAIDRDGPEDKFISRTRVFRRCYKFAKLHRFSEPTFRKKVISSKEIKKRKV